NMQLDGAITGTMGTTLTLLTQTAGRDLGLGGAAAGLDLSDAELDNISNWLMLNIGNWSTSGDITIDQYTWNQDVNITTSGLVTISGDQTINGSGTMVFEIADIAINANMTGANGYLYFQSKDGTNDIGLAGAAGAFSISSAELDRIQDGWALVAFG